MGKDNLTSLSKWKNFEVILQNHAIYVYPRIEAKDRTGEVLSSESESSDLKNHPKVHLIDAIVEISSTFIRRALKKEKHSASFTD
jgi:nicotinate-nucleotide adenylyltransferase